MFIWYSFASLNHWAVTNNINTIYLLSAQKNEYLEFHARISSVFLSNSLYSLEFAAPSEIAKWINKLSMCGCVCRCDIVYVLLFCFKIGTHTHHIAWEKFQGLQLTILNCKHEKWRKLWWIQQIVRMKNGGNLNNNHFPIGRKRWKQTKGSKHEIWSEERKRVCAVRACVCVRAYNK